MTKARHLCVPLWPLLPGTWKNKWQFMDTALPIGGAQSMHLEKKGGLVAIQNTYMTVMNSYVLNNRGTTFIKQKL